MAKPLSRVRFAIRYGSFQTDWTTGPYWTYFDTSIGYIEDWSGILSEGPVGGDIIEQDWVDGALWQQGKNKTYSFDVPFTALVSNNTVEPNLWESYAGIEVLKSYRGPLLTMRREFLDTAGSVVRQEQALGVLVTDLATTVGIGRVIHSVAVFQNLSGAWLKNIPKISTFTEDFTQINPTVWSASTSSIALFSTTLNQMALSWTGQGDAGSPVDMTMKTKRYYDLTESSISMEVIDVAELDEGVSFHALQLIDRDLGTYVSFELTKIDAGVRIRAYSSVLGVLSSSMTYWDPTPHRWLRISESKGVIYWHTSADRVTWAQMYATSASVFPTWRANIVHIGMRDVGKHISTGVLSVANINVAIPRATASAIVDGFIGRAFSTARWISGGNVYPAGGRCVFTWSTTTSQWIMSKPVLNLIGSSVYINSVAITDMGLAHPITEWIPLQMYGVGGFESAGEYIGFRIQYSSGLKISAVAHGYAVTLPVAIPFVQASHSWLRISESGGTITWSTSANGTTWTTMATALASALDPLSWSSSAVRVGASITASATSTTAYKVMELDNLNTLGT